MQNINIHNKTPRQDSNKHTNQENKHQREAMKPSQSPLDDE